MASDLLTIHTMKASAWLAGTVREAKEIAWKEGVNAFLRDQWEDDGSRLSNPYAKATQ